MNFQNSSHKPILGQNGQVADLVTRARQLRYLDQRVRDALGAPLADQCRVAVCRGHRLVLEAASATWGARLRMQSTRLCQQLQSAGLEIQHIEVVVHPELSAARPESPPVTRPRLSETAARNIEAAAAASDDPALSAALRRLASRRCSSASDE